MAKKKKITKKARRKKPREYEVRSHRDIVKCRTIPQVLAQVERNLRAGHYDVDVRCWQNVDLIGTPKGPIKYE